MEPVVHLTCLHYDKAEIDEFARVLTNAGLQNVLALRGDKNPNMREKESFLHASDLIAYMKDKWDFCFLGACYPECHPESEDKAYESNKEALFDAGMSYALSQIIDLLVSDVEGIHLYTMNNPLVARRICEGIRNII